MAMADETKGHGNLDFSAPLLSTRRPALINPHLSSEDSNVKSHRLARDISKRVPFSWERAPGKPKDTQRPSEDLPPTPKLPPARWRPPPKEAATDSSDVENGGAVDNDEEDFYFSDAMDMFSLSESLEVEDDDMSRFDQLEVIEGTGDQSPGFIILPAANTIAPSSSFSSSSSTPPVASSWRNNNRKLRCPKEGLNYNQCDHRSVAESCSTTKACGLTLFFPWRTKPMLCGVKSPTRRGSQQSQTSAGCFN